MENSFKSLYYVPCQLINIFWDEYYSHFYRKESLKIRVTQEFVNKDIYFFNTHALTFLCVPL